MHVAGVLVAKIRTATADQLGGVVVRGTLFRIAVALTTKVGFLQHRVRGVSTLYIYTSLSLTLHLKQR